MPVFTHVTPAGLEPLAQHGFYPVPAKAPYERARLQSKAVTLVLFASNKLLVQGTPANAEETAALLRKLGIGKEDKHPAFREEHGMVIGSDEALKGDTFGGIVVAAVKADDGQRRQLLELGVADSKSLGDEEVLLLAPRIEKMADYEIKNLYPEDYNGHDGNVTALLNRLHKECYYYLKPGKHIVDKYPGCTVGDVAETKAESKYAEVAAASILARATALKQLEELGAEAGFRLPKGSTHVEEALQELKRRRLKPERFVKLNFRNVQKALRE